MLEDVGQRNSTPELGQSLVFCQELEFRLVGWLVGLRFKRLEALRLHGCRTLALGFRAQEAGKGAEGTAEQAEDIACLARWQSPEPYPN